MGVRRLAALVYSLPRDAAIWQQRDWTLQDELAAQQIEQTSGWLWALTQLFAKANFKKGKPIPPPSPIEHPSRPTAPAPKRRSAAGASEIKGFFAKHISPRG